MIIHEYSLAYGCGVAYVGLLIVALHFGARLAERRGRGR